ncbi:MAG TPA: ATP-binding cassette domain-containing protein [Chryseosolibacter sp.]|nr:ATP-binding cassette domain-containing protein [Chryseosolibacter sp.]
MIQSINLSYQYPNGKRLSFPDLILEQGKHCLLLGESGSGKTTMLHLLGGLLGIQNGDIAVNGIAYRDLAGARFDAFRGKHVGFIFQKNHLVSALNVTDNLLLAPYLAGESSSVDYAHAVLNKIGLFEKRDAKISTLSQGQVQRVAIARAVMNKPSVIFADEPTSALDDANCKRVVELLLDAAAEVNASLVIATHDHRVRNMIHNEIVIKPDHV